MQCPRCGFDFVESDDDDSNKYQFTFNNFMNQEGRQRIIKYGARSGVVASASLAREQLLKVVLFVGVIFSFLLGVTLVLGNYTYMVETLGRKASLLIEINPLVEILYMSTGAILIIVSAMGALAYFHMTRWTESASKELSGVLVLNALTYLLSYILLSLLTRRILFDTWFLIVMGVTVAGLSINGALQMIPEDYYTPE